MKAVGYIRVSTTGQAEDGISLSAQEAKIRSWADFNDAEEVIIFRDEGISGKRADNRPGLQAALETLSDGDAFICYSLSRLSRSTKDTIILSEHLQKKNADLVSLSEKIDTTTAAGKMVFRMLAVLNEFERDQVSDRTRFALAHKRDLGEKTGGDVPFGFQITDGNKLIPNTEEQKAIRYAIEQRKTGKSLRAICRAMESAGFARKNGSTSWHPQAIARILERGAAATVPTKATNRTQFVTHRPKCDKQTA